MKRLLAFFDHRDRTEPCPHMVGFLNQAADGSSHGFARWYAVAHALRCKPCGRFLHSLENLVNRLHTVKEEPDADVLKRLSEGSWRSGE